MICGQRYALRLRTTPLDETAAADRGGDDRRWHKSHQASLAGGPADYSVRPQLAVNIGMCARAMANFGLSDLRLVNPREGWPRTGALKKGAYAAAAGAVHLLEAAKLFDSVEEAVADLNCLYATTARERGQLKPVLTPAEAHAAGGGARSRPARSHGILFGPERTGLDNDDIALADMIITFPVNPAYASLNLAQAVLLCGYEWMKAAHRGDAQPFRPSERSPAAPREMMLSFFDYLEGELERSGFFRPLGKRPVMQRNLRNMFHRMNMTEQDVRSFAACSCGWSKGRGRKSQSLRRRPTTRADPPGMQSTIPDFARARKPQFGRETLPNVEFACGYESNMGRSRRWTARDRAALRMRFRRDQPQRCPAIDSNALGRDAKNRSHSSASRSKERPLRCFVQRPNAETAKHPRLRFRVGRPHRPRPSDAPAARRALSLCRRRRGLSLWPAERTRLDRARRCGHGDGLSRTFAPDVVVIACNTASTLVLPHLRAAYPTASFHWHRAGDQAGGGAIGFEADLRSGDARHRRARLYA